MTDEPDLLRAVVAAPEDDATRLVYADWLEEHGQGAADQARSEFIRLQLALAGDPEDSPRRREQAFRARRLLDRYGKRWLAPYRRFRLRGPLFCRGFLDRVAMKAADLATHAEQVFAQIPLTRLWVTDLSGDVSALRRIPASNQLRELDLCGNGLSPESLQVLAELPSLRALRQLGLDFADLGDDAVRVLCERPFYRGLALRCGGNPLPDPAREQLQDRFGARVSFEAERSPDHLYAIRNERFTAGTGRDHTQLLFYGWSAQLRLMRFDHAGVLLTHEYRDVPPVERPSTPWQQLPMEVRQALTAEEEDVWRRTQRGWLKELGYRPGTIRIQRFRLPDGSGIRDYPNSLIEVLATPDDPEREGAPDWLTHWLTDGKFAFDFGGDAGDDWWLNEAGEVTDT